MAQTANAKIVILWDYQLVAAAKALETAHKAEKAEPKNKEEIARLWAPGRIGGRIGAER